MIFDAIKQSIATAADNFLQTRGFVKAERLPAMSPDIIFTNERGKTPVSSFYWFNYWSQLEIQKLAMANPWVFSDAKIIGQIVGEGELQVQKFTNDPKIPWESEPSHDFLKISEMRPNPYMGQYFTWLYQSLWYLLKGEAFWMLVPDQTGRLAEWYPLPSNRVVPIPGNNEALFSAFAYSPIDGMKPHLLPPESVCYHRFPNLFNYHRGYAQLTAYLMSLKIDTEAASFDLDDYQNALSLKQLISFDPEMTDADFNVALSDLDDAAASNRRYMGIRGGDMSVAQISQRRAQEGGDIRDKMASQAGRVFGVFDGFWERSANRASAEVAEANTISYGAWPVMTMFAEDITAQVVIPHYGDEYRVKFKDIRPRDRDLEMKEDAHNRQIMFFGEIRENAELPITLVDSDNPLVAQILADTPYVALKEVAIKIAEFRLNQIQAEMNAERQMEEEEPEIDLEEIEEEEEMEEGELTRAAKSDLKRWKSVALRRLRNGEEPAGYNFESDHIPPDYAKSIYVKLAFCHTEDDIKAIFKPGKRFIPEGAAEFNPVSMGDYDLGEWAANNEEQDAELFHQMIPEFDGILDAE